MLLAGVCRTGVHLGSASVPGSLNWLAGWNRLSRQRRLLVELCGDPVPGGAVLP